ncbi:hypothetical protein HHK36_008225 [Tetracentron sinense]|uniref:glutamyl-tRNA reductase n=1 Tax=Tetracentron sinense TaxID=13715 RepID=A0A834ZF57_TETSI|nr:hypothetical protein HHK36_008225 [Tetracentron sinense]
MVATSGFAASFAGVKMESLLPCKISSSKASPSQIPIFCNPSRNLRRVSERGVSLNPRCEAVSDVLVHDDKINSRVSSVSALEQLKTSAADRYTKERSSIVVIGLSVHTTPVEMREKLAIPEAEWPRAIGELCGLNHIEEAAVLSTCNRMEIYVVALSQHRGVKEVTEWMAKMVVVNRTEERVSAIREDLKDVEIIYKPLTEMLTCAAEADVVFTSTASETPLFLKEHAESLPPVAPEIGGLRLFIDISVPRNVGSCVSDLETARVYNVDDLKEVVAANKEDRLRKAMEAQEIIAEESKQFEAWRDSLETVPTIKKLRAYAERIRVAELEKCLSKMGDDISKKTRRAVDDLSRGIVNKLLHGPMQHLRCDGSDSRTLNETLENMHALNRMFSLETEISVLEQKIRAKVEQTQK